MIKIETDMRGKKPVYLLTEKGKKSNTNGWTLCELVNKECHQIILDRVFDIKKVVFDNKTFKKNDLVDTGYEFKHEVFGKEFTTLTNSINYALEETFFFEKIMNPPYPKKKKDSQY